MQRAGEETGLVLIDAFHYRYHPLFLQVLEIVRGGEIGDVQTIDAGFGANVRQDDPVRRSWDLAAGALMDLGCYPLHWRRHVTGEEPEVLSAEARPHVDPRVDDAITAELAFPSGVRATIHCDGSLERYRAWLRIKGADGEIEVDNPLVPQRGNQLTVRRGTRRVDVGGGRYDLRVPATGVRGVAPDGSGVGDGGGGRGGDDAGDRRDLNRGGDAAARDVGGTRERNRARL